MLKRNLHRTGDDRRNPQHSPLRHLWHALGGLFKCENMGDGKESPGSHASGKMLTSYCEPRLCLSSADSAVQYSIKVISKTYQRRYTNGVLHSHRMNNAPAQDTRLAWGARHNGTAGGFS